MEISLKKAARSLQVGGSGLQDLRYLIQRKVLRLFGRAWRPDAKAVWYFGMEAPTIVDIGANRGFSIDSFLIFRPNASIIAFEPLPSLAETLRIRYEGLENVSIHSCGLGNAPAQLVIYVPIYRGVRWDALASLKHAEAANWVNSDRFYFFDPSKLRIEEESVVVRTLDSFSLEPDIIKILTQGHESLVIQGGAATIRKCEPAIMAPARIPSVNESLVNLGYTRYGFRESKLCEGAEGHTFSWYLKPKHLEIFKCQISRVV